MTEAYLNRIGTALPRHDVHAAFIDWASERLDGRARTLFARMAARAGINHRWSVLPPTADGGSPVAADGFYAGAMPPTSARMALYAEAAPTLAEQAVLALAPDLAGVTHLVVASCTGFVAPGIDQLLAARLGLGAGVERVLIGFMGCYAAVTALRTARHIVRSEPAARVLVVTVELSTLHLQPATDPEPLLAMLLFGDGAAAALVTAEAEGLRLGPGVSLALPDTGGLITWQVGDAGFVMGLSGEVPGRLTAALGDTAVKDRLTRPLMAVHAGGRSILDAVEGALNLPDDALDDARAVLRDCGNMSSATLMFVLDRIMRRGASGEGMAVAFGPGLAAEGIGFSA